MIDDILRTIVTLILIAAYSTAEAQTLTNARDPFNGWNCLPDCSPYAYPLDGDAVAGYPRNNLPNTVIAHNCNSSGVYEYTNIYRVEPVDAISAVWRIERIIQSPAPQCAWGNVEG